MTSAQIAGMHCPACRVPLSLSDRQGVEVDYCPNCRGVWLDRGELDKIIERSLGTLGRSEDDFRDSPRRSHDGGKKGRRESWLSEIFD